MYNEMIGQMHFWVTFIGVNMMFFPQHFLGLPACRAATSTIPTLSRGWNFISSFGSYISGVAVLIFLYGVCEAFDKKRVAGDNPWGEGATTLEWQLSSPPPYHQWEAAAAHPLSAAGGKSDDAPGACSRPRSQARILPRTGENGHRRGAMAVDRKLGN